jgi:hypothetical protein
MTLKTREEEETRHSFIESTGKEKLKREKE